MTRKKLFFIREENLNKIERIEKPSKRDVVILLDENPKSRNHKSLNDDLQQLSKEVHQAIGGYNPRWVQKWAFQKLDNNKCFAEEVVFDKSSLWYFMEFLIQRLKTSEKSKRSEQKEIRLSTILCFIDCVKKIISEIKPSEVIIENTKTPFNQIVFRVCKQEKICIRDLKLKKEKIKISRWLMNKLVLIKAYLKTRIALRKIIGVLFCKRFLRKEILALTSTRLSNKENSTDFFWGPIVKEFDKRNVPYKMVEYDQTSLPGSWKRIFERYVPQKYNAQFIGTYYDGKTKKITKAIVKFLKHKFKELDKRDDFKKSFTYQGINFYEIIRERLIKIFLAYSWYIGDTYAIGKSVIEKEKPNIVLVDHEENFIGKALMLEANKQNIYSICLENEILFSKRTKFLHEPIKIIQDKKSPLWRPVGNKKLVQGEFSKKWFNEKNQMPLKSLKVVGNPKYDFLAKLNPVDKKMILKKYNVKTDEKLVTIISGLAVWEGRYLDMAFKALKNFKKIRVIVKMHPEDPDSNKNIVKGIMKKYGIKGNITKYENTSQLIYSSDFIISCNSTVVFECILLKKNTIVFEPGDYLGWSWVEEGLIKPCTISLQIEKEIKKCLQNKKLINQEKLREYIKKYFYANDGKASQRAVNEIIKVIKHY